MRKTDILGLVTRKLSPYVLLFGLYLITFGHLSPGGGFQGGVVLASGIILLALGRDSEAAERFFPIRALALAEAAAFALLIIAGLGGILVEGRFLENFIPGGVVVPRAGFIFLLNIVIGLKVGSGVGLICLRLFEEEKS
jgi:multicomponent Na+:H+ antiporter subunit B